MDKLPKPKTFITIATKEALQKLDELKCFTLKEAQALGLSTSTISRLVEQNILWKRSPGLYSVYTDDVNVEELDYRLACKKFGSQSIIGGLSAMEYYNLIDFTPKVMWVIVPANVQTTNPLYRLIRSKDIHLDIGVIEEDGFRITSLERTLVEALKYSSKWGKSHAIHAIRISVANNSTNLQKLGNMAQSLGYLKPFLKLIEFIAPEAD